MTTIGPRQVGPGLFDGCEICGDMHCTCRRGPESLLDLVDWDPQAVARSEVRQRLAEFDSLFPNKEGKK